MDTDDAEIQELVDRIIRRVERDTPPPPLTERERRQIWLTATRVERWIELIAAMLVFGGGIVIGVAIGIGVGQ